MLRQKQPEGLVTNLSPKEHWHTELESTDSPLSFDPLGTYQLLNQKCGILNLSLDHIVSLSVHNLILKGDQLDPQMRTDDLIKQRHVDGLRSLISQNPTELSLRRIAACNPKLSALIAIQINRKRNSKVPGFDECHPLIRSEFFAPVCPNSSQFDHLANTNFRWILEYRAFCDPYTSHEAREALNWTLSRSSPLLSEVQRLAFMYKLGISPETEG